jgi:N-acetylglucosamine-6-phosphate deacetylase
MNSCSDSTLRPALFDLQVNGFAGVDFQQRDLSLAQLRDAAAALRRHRIHRILLTLITDEIDALCRKLAQVERYRQEDQQLAELIPGYHIEGPYLSPKPGFRGAHPADKMKAPDSKEFSLIQEAAGGNIRLITIAPEWDRSDEFTAETTRAGVVVSLGHTDASEAEIDRAIAAGATMCTHLGNGCAVDLHRHDNIIHRLLARDELIACFIPDGIHVPPPVLKNLFRAKPAGKVLLTADCMAAAAAPSGRYKLGGIEVEVGDDRVVRMPGQPHFAGSSLTLDEGVANFAKWTGLSFEQAWSLASTAVADALGLDLPMLEASP